MTRLAPLRAPVDVVENIIFHGRHHYHRIRMLYMLRLSFSPLRANEQYINILLLLLLKLSVACASVCSTILPITSINT